MKIEVRGQVFPCARNSVFKVEKIGEKRRKFNLGSQTFSFSIYEVDLSDDCELSGDYIRTPSGIRLYHNKGGQYQQGYLISEQDKDSRVRRHF